MSGIFPPAAIEFSSNQGALSEVWCEDAGNLRMSADSEAAQLQTSGEVTFLC